MGIAVDGQRAMCLLPTLYNYAIRKVSASGTITTVVQAEPFASAQLNDPTGVAVDGAGNLFIADNNVIRRVSASTGFETAIAELGSGSGIAADEQGDVFVADSSSNSVRKLTPTSQTVLITAVVDAASERAGPVSPGEIIVIYGAGLGPTQGVTAAPSWWRVCHYAGGDNGVRQWRRGAGFLCFGDAGECDCAV